MDEKKGIYKLIIKKKKETSFWLDKRRRISQIRRICEHYNTRFPIN